MTASVKWYAPLHPSGPNPKYPTWQRLQVRSATFTLQVHLPPRGRHCRLVEPVLSHSQAAEEKRESLKRSIFKRACLRTEGTIENVESYTSEEWSANFVRLCDSVQRIVGAEAVVPLKFKTTTLILGAAMKEGNVLRAGNQGNLQGSEGHDEKAMWWTLPVRTESMRIEGASPSSCGLSSCPMSSRTTYRTFFSRQIASAATCR